MNQIYTKTVDGTEIMALVLEPGNIHRLRKGEPISARIQDLFPDGIPNKLELRIYYSDTPIADARDLAGTAEMAFDERTAANKERRPHCPECRSTIEQLGLLRTDPISTFFCPQCGCVLGVQHVDR